MLCKTPTTNMVRGGRATGDDVDASSGKRSKKPIYDGKTSTWPAFRITAKGYIAENGWTGRVIKGIKPVPIVRADNTRYWIFRRDGSKAL